MHNNATNVAAQGPATPEAITVRELVELGRYPYAGVLGIMRTEDHQAVRDAIALTGLEGFQNRLVDTLSGGERQRAWIAMTLAQGTPLLLLDEPTTFLDIGHQLEVMELVVRLNLERGLTVVLVLHDLNQAARYADRLVVLQRGRIVADGSPHHVLTQQLLQEVFSVRARIFLDPDTGTPVCLPYARAE